MNRINRRCLLGLVVVMVTALFLVIKVTAGVVIEDYNPKLNGVQGKITKIEGNRLTIMSEKGNLITIGIAGKSRDDKHQLRLFKIGDRIKIQDGKLFQLSDLQKQPLEPAGEKGIYTTTSGSPAQGK